MKASVSPKVRDLSPPVALTASAPVSLSLTAFARPPALLTFVQVRVQLLPPDGCGGPVVVVEALLVTSGLLLLLVTGLDLVTVGSCYHHELCPQTDPAAAAAAAAAGIATLDHCG